MLDSVAALLSAAREVVNCDHEGGEGPCESHLLKLGAALAAWATRPALRSYDALILPIMRRTDADEVAARHLLDELEKLALGPRTADTMRKG